MPDPTPPAAEEAPSMSAYAQQALLAELQRLTAEIEDGPARTARLNQQRAAVVRHLKESGMPVTAIAEASGIHFTHLYRILREAPTAAS